MIKGLWISNKGVLLYKKGMTNQKGFDTYDECLAGILQALYDFCKEGMDEKMTQFITDKHVYHIYKKSGLLFIGRFGSKANRKEIKYQLSSIAKQFFKIYPKVFIDVFGHKISLFRFFDNYVRLPKEYILDKIESLWRVKSDLQDKMFLAENTFNSLT